MGSFLSKSREEQQDDGLPVNTKTVEHVKELLEQGDGMEKVYVPTVSTGDADFFDFPKVELHLHVDGAIRFKTILEVSEKRKIPIIDPKTGKIITTEDDLKALLVTHTPANLGKVLEAFNIFLPVVKGDFEAIERIAYELCEDQAKNGVIYFEGRYGPNLLAGEHDDPVDVIRAIKRGFDRGEKDFGVKARSILCAIRGLDQYTDAIFTLARDHKDLGVVAIDVAGSAHGADEQYEPNVVEIFKKAFEAGIHRTVHAGESGGPKEMKRALEDMHAERIGHGYRVLRDMDFYKERFVDDHTVHLEACPYSSVMTGAVPLDWKNHPISRWAEDKVNFSISRDDPTCFDNCMLSELKLTYQRIGLTKHQLWQAQLNGARSTFLPDDEKHEIIDRILRAEPKNE